MWRGCTHCQGTVLVTSWTVYQFSSSVLFCGVVYTNTGRMFAVQFICPSVLFCGVVYTHTDRMFVFHDIDVYTAYIQLVSTPSLFVSVPTRRYSGMIVQTNNQTAGSTTRRWCLCDAIPFMSRGCTHCQGTVLVTSENSLSVQFISSSVLFCGLVYTNTGRIFVFPAIAVWPYCYCYCSLHFQFNSSVHQFISSILWCCVHKHRLNVCVPWHRCLMSVPLLFLLVTSWIVYQFSSSVHQFCSVVLCAQTQTECLCSMTLLSDVCSQCCFCWWPVEQLISSVHQFLSSVLWCCVHKHRPNVCVAWHRCLMSAGTAVTADSTTTATAATACARQRAEMTQVGPVVWQGRELR
jgi:hypothetical protein